MDPYEKSTVYIGEGVSGDGIFAKREIKSGELIVYYAGIKVVFQNRKCQP